MISQNIENIIQMYPCNIRMVAKNLKTNQLVINYRSNERVVSASLIKVPMLLAALRQVEIGKYKLEDIIPIQNDNKVEFSVISEQDLTSCSLYEILVWMIITSDNTATNVLIDLLGIDNLNSFFKEIGLQKTTVQRKMMDFHSILEGRNNYTSPSDILLVFEGLYKSSIINEKYSEVALEILRNQRVNDSLKRYIHKPLAVAHKTGELDHINHDAGIFFCEHVDYFIGIFITEVESNEIAKRIIGKLSRLLYEHITSQGGIVIESNCK